MRKTTYGRQEIVDLANAVLVRRGLKNKLVTNPGIAAAVVLRDRAGQSVDPDEIADRFRDIDSGSSFSQDDYVPGKIIATDTHALVVEFDPDSPTSFDDLLSLVHEVKSATRVHLCGRGEKVCIDGKMYPPITDGEYDVIQALQASEPMTKDQLPEKSRHPGAVNILKRLMKKPGWASVIKLPGRTGMKYRIL